MSRIFTSCVIPLCAATLIMPTHFGFAQTGLERRDRFVSAPGNRFDGTLYWNAMTQCAVATSVMGALNTVMMLQEKLKLEEKLETDKSKFESAEKAAAALRTQAMGFYGAAERFLVADRQINLREASAVVTARQAEIRREIRIVPQAEPLMKPCADLQQVCARQYAEICSGRR